MKVKWNALTKSYGRLNQRNKPLGNPVLCMMCLLILGYQYLTFWPCYLLRNKNSGTTDDSRILYGRIQRFEQFQFDNICGRVCGRGTFLLCLLQLNAITVTSSCLSFVVSSCSVLYAYTRISNALEPVLFQVEQRMLIVNCSVVISTRASLLDLVSLCPFPPTTIDFIRAMGVSFLSPSSFFVLFARICQPSKYSPTLLRTVIVLALVVSVSSFRSSSSFVGIVGYNLIVWVKWALRKDCWYSPSSLLTLLYQLPITMQTRVSLHSFEFLTVTSLWR